MCLTYKSPYTGLPTDTKLAYKLFAIKNEQLYSPMGRTLLPYDVNKDLDFVPIHDSIGFYSFENRNHCYVYVNDQINIRYIVLPVTISDIVYQGYVLHRSNDIQSFDGYYTAYISKRIKVHHTPETLKMFECDTKDRILKATRFSKLSKQERDFLTLKLEEK